MDDLRTILLRFERAWGFTEEDCAEATALVREGDAKMAEAGGDPMKVTPWSTMVFGLSGRPRNGVQPHLVVRLPAPTFSTYTRLTWDPEVKPDGDEIVGSRDGSSEVPEPSSCVPRRRRDNGPSATRVPDLEFTASALERARTLGWVSRASSGMCRAS